MAEERLGSHGGIRKRKAVFRQRKQKLRYLKKIMP